MYNIENCYPNCGHYFYFDSNKKFSKVSLSDNTTYFKGAFEVLLEKCLFKYQNNKKDLMSKNLIFFQKKKKIIVKKILLKKRKVLNQK